jgi:hypothetical protein
MGTAVATAPPGTAVGAPEAPGSDAVADGKGGRLFGGVAGAPAVGVASAAAALCCGPQALTTISNASSMNQ